MTIFEKLKIWGVRGAIDYIDNRLRERHVKKLFRVNAEEFPVEHPQTGITVVGTLSSRGSLNKTLRDFCFSLNDAGIPFQAWDLGDRSVPDEDVSPILTPREKFRIAKYTHLVEMIRSPVPDGLVRNRGRIVFWEFESGLLEGYPMLAECGGDVIGMSDFNFNYYRRVLGGIREVRKILYPLRLSTATGRTKDESRAKFGIPEQAFVVFYNFSYKSGIDRKNPGGALKAFARSLADKPGTMMLFKTASSSEYPTRVSELKNLSERLGIADRVRFIDDYLTQQEVLDLTNACDVYLSLHRAEGFGLGIAEAMSLGKPVVVTNYSSTTEFCNSDNSVPIGYVITGTGDTQNNLYSAAEHWAEPDLDEAAEALLNLYEKPDYGKRIGQSAKESIFRQYSIANFRESVLKYINEGRAV